MPNSEHERLLSLGAIARHAAPNVVLSTLVPTALFYAGWYTQGRLAAFALALGWAFTLLAWRAVRRERIPAMLVLTSVLLGLRTALALTTGGTKIYFVQPIVTMIIVGSLFLVTMLAGQPLVSRLAHDICPIPADVADSAEMRGHFRRLSYLWAGVYFVNASVTLLLLLNLPVGAFVATHSFVGLAIMWAGAAVTASWSRPVLRATGLLRAVEA